LPLINNTEESTLYRVSVSG